MSGVSPEQEWFEKADQDLEMARRALGPEKPLPGMACYHAQQCAENIDNLAPMTVNILKIHFIALICL